MARVCELLSALPQSLSPPARLTMILLWEDAGRSTGPVEVSMRQMMAATKLSRHRQVQAVSDLCAAGLLTRARRYDFVKGSRWVRFLTSPVPASLEA